MHFFAALRDGETRALDWTEINLVTGLIVVRFAMDSRRRLIAPKSSAGKREVPIEDALRPYLIALRGDCDGTGFVFGTTPDTAYAPTTVRRHTDEAWTAAGLRAITPHECRHSCVSTWVAAGVPLPTVSRWAGHESPSFTLARYSHCVPNSDALALDLLARYRSRAGDVLGDEQVG